MYIPGRSRTCSTPSRTWISADEYLLDLVAAARFVAVLAKDPPSWNADTPDRDVTSRGPTEPRWKPASFYQSGMTPKAVSGTFPAVRPVLESLALQAFPRFGPDDHADRGDAPGAERLLGPNADPIGQETDLRAPRPGGRGDHQDAALQAHRGRLRGQPGAHHVGPSRGELADRHAPGERLLPQQPVHDLP